MTHSTPGLQSGQVISETYEIERLLGRGGMGEVWLATHKRLKGKQVAIKVLHVAVEALTADALARFRREAEIAARLSHPNIVEVLDFNTLPNGTPYLVMEYLRGESLAARLKRSPLSAGEISHVMKHVGAALQVAHAAGVVHRDLKPENIFLIPTAAGDTVKVLDFGISKLANSSTVQTTESALIGTPLYMSPEQALGNNKEVSSQSDLFSLGSITYELLSGIAPFAAPNIATVVHKIAFQPHQPLTEVVPGAPAAFVTAINHALQKDKALRTTDVETFVFELTNSQLTPVSMPSTAGAHESSGVFSPDSPVSASMLDAATLMPGPISGKVTPVVASVPAAMNAGLSMANTAAPAPGSASAIPPAVPSAATPLQGAPALAPVDPHSAKTKLEEPSNPKGALYGALGAAAVIAVIGVMKFATGSRETPVPPSEVKPAPPAKVVPATQQAPGSLAVDLMKATGQAVVEEIRGVPADAGSVAPQETVALKPVTPVEKIEPVPESDAPTPDDPGQRRHDKLRKTSNAADEAKLLPLREAYDAKEWDRLVLLAPGELQTRPARIEAAMLLLEANCRLKRTQSYRRYYDELVELGLTGKAFATCKRFMPDIAR